MDIHRIDNLINDISCDLFPNWGINHNRHEGYIQIVAVDKCSQTGKPYMWKGRKWRLSSHMTDSEVVQTIFLAYQTAMEHDLREFFKWKGEAIFRPHFDIRVLHELSAHRAIEVRDD